MTKLYTVTFEIEYLIAVEEGQDPEDVAYDSARQVLEDYDIEPRDFFIYETNTIPDGWTDQCCPYASNKTMREIREEQTSE